MGKDPAFLFYPGDWLGGTMGMSLEQKGCYFELLMMQFNNGKFTEEQAKRVLSVCFDNAWPTIKHKFEFDGGYYWNERLAEEKEKRLSFIESRRLSGLNPKNNKAHAKRKHKRSGDGNEDVNNNKDREYILPEFKETFNRWLIYKKDKNQSYKNEDSIKMAYNKLIKLSGSDPETVRLIVEQSLANNWDGLFPLKEGTKTEEPEILHIKTGPYSK